MPVVPIVLAALPIVTKTVEAIFGPKTGETKKDVVMKVARIVADQLAARGDGPAPSDETLDGFVETVVAKLNEKGELKGLDIRHLGPGSITLSYDQLLNLIRSLRPSSSAVDV